MNVKLKFQPTESQIIAAKNVFAAMALVDTLKPIVIGYKNKILAEMQAKSDKEWGEQKVILDETESYLLSDKDAEFYYKRCDEEMTKANLSVEKPGQCPLLVAENLLTQSRHILINEMAKTPMFVGITVNKLLCKGIDTYNKFVDLSLTLIIKSSME